MRFHKISKGGGGDGRYATIRPAELNYAPYLVGAWGACSVGSSVELFVCGEAEIGID